MPTRSQLKATSRLRLKEAESLYSKELYEGCVYLCGYVVELALKARVCRVLGLKEYPESGDVGRLFKTHDFDVLKTLAGLESDLTAVANPDLFANWSLATEWDVKRRYDPPGTQTRHYALGVLEALRQRPYGVLTWLKKRW